MQSANVTDTDIRKPSNCEAGQGMTEYIIIVALIAVAAIGVYSLFGQTIRGQVGNLAAEVAGNQSAKTEAKTNMDKAAKDAAGASKDTKGMADYGQLKDK